MKPLAIAVLIAAAMFAPRAARAYSVLAHQSNIDALWDAQIRPVLLAKYPRTSPDALLAARAYAYGGSVIQDMGYYPFGSKLFTNLLHYVKTGDFVAAMLSGAQDVNEYAFAVGALCHYASDHEGHSIAVNKAVPLIYPKMRQRFGDVVPYDKAPKQHILVEFAFDVLLVAHGGYQLQAYHEFIGFKVAKPALERAFQATYGLEMKDLFLNEDLAIGTFRHAVGKMIPDVTKIAWEKKQEQIQKITPGAVRNRFVLSLPRVEYEREFGKDYRKPGAFARVLGFLYKLLPKIGPLKPLAFTVPTPEAEKLFLDSLRKTRERFGDELAALRRGNLKLVNVNLDTGKPSARGEYALADETTREWNERLLEHKADASKGTQKSKND
jgi:hypothetical protein